MLSKSTNIVTTDTADMAQSFVENIYLVAVPYPETSFGAIELWGSLSPRNILCHTLLALRFSERIIINLLRNNKRIAVYAGRLFKI